MPATIEQVAEVVNVAPGDVRALIAIYPDDDATDLWTEQDVLSKVGIDQVPAVLNPHMCAPT